jgi:hypothetical protein
MMRMTIGRAWLLMFFAAGACGGHGGERMQPPMTPVALPVATHAAGVPPQLSVKADATAPKRTETNEPLPQPDTTADVTASKKTRANESQPLRYPAESPPRPYTTAELSAPDARIFGIGLTVLGAPPKVSGDFESSYPSAASPNDIDGVLVSARLYPPLAWERLHGSMEGYVATGPEVEPSFTFSGRAATQPVELLVFGPDAFWLKTAPLLPRGAPPYARYVSPKGSLVVVVAAGTAKRMGIGSGWSIAVSM